jgi:PIN domain nuclease of toxin-antitoxin system
MTLAVTDTHALMWWSRGDVKKLGRTARSLFEKTEAGRAAVYVPVFSLIEVAEAMRRGFFEPTLSFEAWTRQLLASGAFIAVDLGPDILYEAEALYAIPERGDRLIAATAVHLGYPLITKDSAIKGIRGIETIW